jgi:hypothetical protein
MKNQKLYEKFIDSKCSKEIVIPTITNKTTSNNTISKLKSK